MHRILLLDIKWFPTFLRAFLFPLLDSLQIRKLARLIFADFCKVFFRKPFNLGREALFDSADRLSEHQRRFPT